jgi:hypothetical protein
MGEVGLHLEKGQATESEEKQTLKQQLKTVFEGGLLPKLTFAIAGSKSLT